MVDTFHAHSTTSGRLNIFYMLLDKMQSFSDGKFDVSSTPGAQIASDYETKRTDAWEKIENMTITKRIISTCKSPISAFFLLCSHPC